MYIRNIIGLIVIIFVLYLCYTNAYEKFSSYVLVPELMNNVCSMTCCNHPWTPLNLDTKYVKMSDMGTKYKASGTMCDNGQDTGCLCIPIN